MKKKVDKDPSRNKLGSFFRFISFELRVKILTA
jgi:hypothetical protein